MRAFPKLIGCLVAVFALSVCIPSRLSAQGFGSINGTVTDASGAVVPGAKITAIQASTGISSETTSGSQGQLRISNSRAFELHHYREGLRI